MASRKRSVPHSARSDVTMDTDFNRDGPGTENWRPVQAEPDAIFFRTRSTHGSRPSDPAGFGPVPGDLMPPDPSVGGEMAQFGQLGWSTGFGAFRRFSPFTGRVITAKPLGAHPPVGPVGYSTRSARLRKRVEALYTDYTPSDQEVAQEVLRDGRI